MERTDGTEGLSYASGNAMVLDHLKESKIFPRFLFYYLMNREFKDIVTGTSQPQIIARNLSKVCIPLPPLPEQQRLAEILDKADAIRRQRKEAIRVTEALLRSAFLEMFGDPITNPKGWDVKPLGNLAKIVGGGTPSRTTPAFFRGRMPWATAKDFKDDLLFDTEEHISEHALQQSAAKRVEPGTVLVVVKSKILMHRLPVAIAQVPLCFNQDVKGLIPHNTNESSFLAAHLRLSQSHFLRLARGANTEGLTMEHIKPHKVMRPPEKTILAFSQIELQIRNILTKSRNALEEAEKLFQSLLHRAFRGELSR